MNKKEIFFKELKLQIYICGKKTQKCPFLSHNLEEHVIDSIVYEISDTVNHIISSMSVPIVIVGTFIKYTNVILSQPIIPKQAKTCIGSKKITSKRIYGYKEAPPYIYIQ